MLSLAPRLSLAPEYSAIEQPSVCRYVSIREHEAQKYDAELADVSIAYVSMCEHEAQRYDTQVA